jgi:thiol-disulfide isomerase/thioredoxin
MEVCLETREDLVDLLKCSTYEYIVLKFKAEWCKPCKVIDPFIHNLVDDKINVLNKKNETIKWCSFCIVLSKKYL